METTYYPVFFQLKNKLCVVIGGGDVAARKAASLLAAGAAVRVVSPDLHPELESLAASGRIEALRCPYTKESLAGATLVIAATSRADVNREAAADCRALGIPVNVVDAPGLCDFIVPATLRRGPLTIAVSTGGSMPAMAKKIRRRLEEEFDEAYGELLDALGEARTRVLRDVEDPARRKAIFTALSGGDLLTVLRQEGRSELDKQIDEIIKNT
ncbi:MAG: bifunctional precorrin-2 dehydrogenase/sirohydrochlorin ferrochelatase [Bacillota bacterium]|nr:bifunctional precorrin-2 dehydrogenase/sirohydrochlorin ferrochelatase [Bacillota bacterium]MDW7685181.1 bifunctional precorrin-2 dehydrogenase/sirohydrochlorin ferrochelatase [Bacillota bacterium]